MFLEGQTGTGGTVDHGSCIVPSGTSVFYPLINFVDADCRSNPSKPPTLCTSVKQTPAHGQPFADLRKIANDFIDGVDVSSLQSTLDGKPIDFARVQSPPGGFGVRVTANNAMACEIVDRHIKNTDNIFFYLDEIFYNLATMRCFINMM
jgi:hypothetical protein